MKTDTVVISVDYAKSLDDPFPAAVVTSKVALEYVWNNLKTLVPNAKSLSLAGGSAGAI
eukprot:UN26411